MPRKRLLPRRNRRAAIVLLSAFLLVVIIGAVALALDLGFVVLVRTELQVAADSSAMAAAAAMYQGTSEAISVAQRYAREHWAGGKPVQLDPSDVEFGIWDADTQSFQVTGTQGNAVRVTARRERGSANGDANFFFGRIFGRDHFETSAQAIAMSNPRDVVFVVDLSGSMNDDTEPAWATSIVNGTFGDEYPGIGDDLMQDVFDDFGFGSFPGEREYVGAPLGVPSTREAYAEMTKNFGYLSLPTIPAQYRILATDNEVARKRKAYRWMIDNQIARLMPDVSPEPTGAYYRYWEKYLDYIIQPYYVPNHPDDDDDDDDDPRTGLDIDTDADNVSGPGSSPDDPGGGDEDTTETDPPDPSPFPEPPPIGFNLVPVPQPWIGMPWQLARHSRWGQVVGRTAEIGVPLLARRGVFSSVSQLVAENHPPGAPPYGRGYVPVYQDGDRINQFNNPNTFTFPTATRSLPYSHRNYIGYTTYVQFMMDHGRNLRPDGNRNTQLSYEGGDCPLHWEGTPGGNFQFPPRSQPMHAARRSIIAAMAYVKEKNEAIPEQEARDWVSVVSYDSVEEGGPKLVHTLTGNYESAMRSCTTMQAMGDKFATTATESGLKTARHHLRPESQGGQGREKTSKVVILLTDGVPNVASSSESRIDSYLGDHPNRNFYGDGRYWYDGPLMQAHMMNADKWRIYPVGIGFGTDYDFMDRMARMGGTANHAGQSPRGSGNPAEYEQRLTELFEQIIDTPFVQLVQ